MNNSLLARSCFDMTNAKRGIDSALPDFDAFPFEVGPEILICMPGSCCKSHLESSFVGLIENSTSIDPNMFQVSQASEWSLTDVFLVDALQCLRYDWSVKPLIVWGSDLFLDSAFGIMLAVFTLMWALLLAGVLDGVLALIKIFVRQRWKRQSLFFWPSASYTCHLLCMQCLSLVCNIAILACDAEETEGPRKSVGVQILRDFRYLNYLMVLCLSVFCLCRFFEEAFRLQIVPQGCELIAGARHYRQKKVRRTTRWRHLFLLMNVCTAECVGLGDRTEWELFAPDAINVSDEYPGDAMFSNDCGCPSSPCGEPSSKPIRSPRIEGLRDPPRLSQFCCSLDKHTVRGDMHLLGHPGRSCARLGNQTECSAEHDICPRFDAFGATHVLEHDSGDDRFCVPSRIDSCCGENDSGSFYCHRDGNQEQCQMIRGVYGVNTAPPTQQNQTKPYPREKDVNEQTFPDFLSMMQRGAPLPEARQFAVASERGLPYLKVCRLTRRIYTHMWYEQGIDLAYQHFRQIEYPVWEKKIAGWSYTSREDEFGAPFAVQLMRRGLWSAQLFTPFEDAGLREINFVTVIPQPLMVEIAGSSSNQHDTVVLAFTDEELADDRLPLVVRHLFTGTVETTAIRCLPGCNPNVLCASLGAQHMCEDGYQGRVYFRFHDVIRDFYGYDRIGLPAGAHVQLQRVPVGECEAELPHQRPLREHQQMILPQDTVPVSSMADAQVNEHAPQPQLETDGIQMMQRYAIASVQEPDLAYVLETSGMLTQLVDVWLHTWDRRHEWVFTHRRHRVSLAHMIKPQILHQWRDYQVRPQASLVPVRPSLTGPIFLLLPICPESWVAILATADVGIGHWTGTIMYQTRYFPFVHEMFQQKLPTIPCVWETECSILAAGRVYEWEQRVPIYTGIAIIFRERPRLHQIPAYLQAPHRDPNETSIESNDDLVTGTYVSTETDASEESPCSTMLQESQAAGLGIDVLSTSMGVNTATPNEREYDESDEVHYMQHAVTDDRIGRLLTSPFQQQPRCGTIQVSMTRRSGRDELQEYAVTWHGRASGIRSVYTWVVLKVQQIVVLPRICVMQAGRHFTDRVISTWEDSDFHGDLVFTTADPVLGPLTPRAQPIDLVATTSMQFDLGFRVYLIDVLLGMLPRRVALLSSGRDRVRDLAARLGYAEFCLLVQCRIAQPAHGTQRTWKGDDIVDEPHGAALLLEHERLSECPVVPSPQINEYQGAEDLSLMQTRRLLRKTHLDMYLGNFATRTSAVTFWVHAHDADVVQQYPDLCEVDVRRDAEQQCDHLWIERDMPANSRITVIDPAPVFISLPKPHVVVDRSNDPTECPVLCQVVLDGRTNLLSLVAPIRHPPTSVAFIFALVLPQNDCEFSSECYLYYGRRRYEHYHDVQLHFGAFLRLYEWTRGESATSSTSCGSGATDHTDFTWDSTYEAADRIDVSEDQDQKDYPLLDEIGHQEENTVTSQVPIDIQSASISSTEGDNTATPYHDATVDELLYGFSLVQTEAYLQEEGQPEARESDIATPNERSTLQVSTISDAPPPMTLLLNRDFDWLLSWGCVRRFLTEYDRVPCRLRLPGFLLVHLIADSAQGVQSIFRNCPSNILVDEVPIDSVIQWCAQRCFPLRSDVSRAFPAERELYQGIPTVVIVQNLQVPQVPVIVQVSDQHTALYYVYHAYSFERVANIVDWLNGRVNVVLPLEVCYEGRRVLGAQDIPMRPGAVVQVRVQSWAEHMNPLPLTNGSGPTLDYVTHSTWESLPASSSHEPAPRAISEINSQAEGVAEHTLEPQRPRILPEGTSLLQHDLELTETALVGMLDADDSAGMEATKLWQQLVQGRFAEDHQCETLENYFDQQREDYQAWRRFVHRLHRDTLMIGIDRLLDEAQAHRAARRVWPEFVVAALPDRWYRGTPTPHHHLNIENMMIYMQQGDEDVLSRQRIHIIGVFPYVTLYEQQGEEALYMLVDLWPENDRSMVLVLEDHWNNQELVFWPLTIPRSVWTTDLLRTVGRLEECMQETIDCTLKYHEVELPTLVTWQSIPGMKLNLVIQHEGSHIHECQSYSQSDENSMMQLPVELAVLEARRVDHQQRRERDDVYRIVADEQGGPLDIPPGGTAKFWLIPGEGMATHDAVIRLELKPQIPDWHGWASESWRMAPRDKKFVRLLQRPLANSPENNDFFFIGTSARDAEQGMRVLLVDLIYANVMRRGALRCNLLTTVAEIARTFTTRGIPQESPIWSKFRLYWHDGQRYQVYTAFEVPHLPAGSYVRILQASDACTTERMLQPPDPRILQIALMPEEQPRDEADEASHMQLLTHAVIDERKDAFSPENVASDHEGRGPLVERLKFSWWHFPEKGQIAVDTATEHGASTFETGEDATEMQVVDVRPNPASPSGEEQHHKIIFVAARYQHLLVDLIMPRNILRMAVQCRRQSTVLDIFRILARRRWSLKARLSTSFTLTWQSPEGKKVFSSYEVPQVPVGAYVLMQVTETSCIDGAAAMWAQRYHAPEGHPNRQEETDQDTDSGVTSLLQLSAALHTSWSSIGEVTPWQDQSALSVTLNRQVDPFERLRPPGNPTCWLSCNLFDMDRCLFFREMTYVVDAGCTMRSEKVQLSLQTCLHLPVYDDTRLVVKSSDPVDIPIVLNLRKHLPPGPPAMKMPNFDKLLTQICQGTDRGWILSSGSKPTWLRTCWTPSKTCSCQ